MRYFKFKNPKVTEKMALKMQYAKLSKDEKRLVRKEKTLNMLATILLFTVGTVCFVGCVALIGKIPTPNSLFFKIIHSIGIILLWIASVIVSGIVGGLVSIPIWNKMHGSRRSRRVIKQQTLSEACAHLRDYYELQEPCIVTKCYDSSNKSFINHDVCIFVVDDELRITANLKHGFFHCENDLGCYAFQKNEITLLTKQGEKFLITEFKAGDTTFLLGSRAKSFIEKTFISI